VTGRVAPIWAELGSDHLQEQEFGTLSQGEQQKVLIARARITKPYSIILDEPCAGRDPGARDLFSFAAESRWPEKNAGVDLRDPSY
jgi:iron complex transport system ATP-binding protein